jgi:rod shape determining protein RodA
MRFGRRLWFSFDWAWFLALLGLAAVGLVAIWSTTQGTTLNLYFGRQVLYLAFALLLFCLLLCFDYHVYADFSTFVYAASIALLVLVLFAGRSVHNNKSWLDVGFFAFQPSELVKIVVILTLAKYYSEAEGDYLGARELLIGGLMVLLPFLLTLLQGDLGTAVAFLPIYVALSFLAGLKRKHVLIMLLGIITAVPLGWVMMKDYQKGRIETIFNPASDPHRLGYHTIQSKIAIGSGRFLGKGFKQGSQGQLGFLPARHTDFIFAVWSEERGFVGSMGLLMLFMFVSFRLLRAAWEAKDRIGTMIIAGFLPLFLFHIFINIGMVVGLLPIAGIPLPFVSAGGSSLVSFFVAMSLCMNIDMRRYVN